MVRNHADETWRYRMTMDVNTLLEILEDLQAGGLGDAPVHLAQQPHYPLNFSIDQYANVAPDWKAVELPDGFYWNDEDEEDDNIYHLDNPDRPIDHDRRQVILADCDLPVVYIPEGNQVGYLPGTAARAVGWR